MKPLAAVAGAGAKNARNSRAAAPCAMAAPEGLSYDLLPSTGHDHRSGEDLGAHAPLRLRQMKSEIEAMRTEILSLEEELSGCPDPGDRRMFLKPLLDNKRHRLRRNERMFVLQVQQVQWESELAEKFEGSVLRGNKAKKGPRPPKRDEKGKLVPAKGPRVANHHQLIRETVKKRRQR